MYSACQFFSACLTIQKMRILLPILVLLADSCHPNFCPKQSSSAVLLHTIQRTFTHFVANDVGIKGTLRLRGGSTQTGQVIKCCYSQEWDNQGVFFLLGTMPPLPEGATPGSWINPGRIGRARIHYGDGGYIGISGIMEPEIQLDPSEAIERVERPGCSYFPDGWVAVELPPNFQLLPHHYTLRNGGGTVVACMTGWVLEGSQSMEGPWQTLDRKGASKNVLPMAEHQCVVFNDLAEKTPTDQ